MGDVPSKLQDLFGEASRIADRDGDGIGVIATLADREGDEELFGTVA